MKSKTHNHTKHEYSSSTQGGEGAEEEGVGCGNYGEHSGKRSRRELGGGAFGEGSSEEGVRCREEGRGRGREEEAQ